MTSMTIILVYSVGGYLLITLSSDKANSQVALTLLVRKNAVIFFFMACPFYYVNTLTEGPLFR